MNNKCEWKNGKLLNCDKSKSFGLDVIHCAEKLGWNNCPFCGSDIRKPEENPLIVKSGDTYALVKNNINYLCMKPLAFKGMTVEHILARSLTIKYPEQYGFWKPFSEITLTDEIAKLRPMVMVKEENFYLYKAKLWGKDVFAMLIISYNIEGNLKYISPDNCRLATPHELQDSTK